MKKVLLLSIFSVAFFSLSVAQQLQYTKWTTLYPGNKDTVTLHLTLDTYTLSSREGIIASGQYTESNDVVVFQDFPASNTCPYEYIGFYEFVIFNGNVLSFDVLDDRCTQRVEWLTTTIWQGVPGKILHVPTAEYPTIKSGINAAIRGDTILVAEGKYYEQINFKGKKPLTVASQFLLDGDVSHISKTIIDGSHATDPDNASVVYFVTGEDTTSILCGFTIQNGKGTFIPDDLGDWDTRVGGGIWIAGAGAKIIHNRITHNTLDGRQLFDPTNASGAGIATPYENTNFWLVIADNTIDSNYCFSKHYEASGAGIITSYNTRLTNNIISNNACTGELEASAIAGGIGVVGEYWPNPLIFIAENNTITHNITQSVSMANSAGVLVQVAKMTFTGNEVSENSVIDGLGIDFSGGGGMFLLNTIKGSVVRNNVFTGNTSNEFSGAIHLKNFEESYDTVLIENNYFIDNQALNGGAISVLAVPVIMQNNVFRNNQSTTSGGALYLRNTDGITVKHLSVLINNTFSKNASLWEGGAIYLKDANSLIFNSILWENPDISENEIVTESGYAEIAYSDIITSKISGNKLLGPGIIGTDPLFVDPLLMATKRWSPCVDAGVASYKCIHNETFTAPAFDITGIPRPAGIKYDMGAYDVAYTTVGISDVKPVVPFSAWPNPFTNFTTITYTLTESAQVMLRVYDSYGRLVAEPVNASQQKGEQKFDWNAGNLPAGIYYCRLQTGNKVVSTTVVKLN